MNINCFIFFLFPFCNLQIYDFLFYIYNFFLLNEKKLVLLQFVYDSKTL